MKRSSQRVLVLGSGITGAGVALSLATRGIPVTLIDQDARPINRASLRNEGKIHLGLIYANDRTLDTARLQLRGALHFRSLLRRWVGSHAESLTRSTTFLYVVARDSMLTAEQLSRHYSSVEDLYRDFIAADPSLDYLGARPHQLAQQCSLSGLRDLFDVTRLSAAYRTAEVAVDTDALAGMLRTAIAQSPLITFLPRHKVLNIGRANGMFEVEGIHAEGQWRLGGDQVVNAMWENRIVFDRMIGIDCPKGWVHRLKYRVIARLPKALLGAPSVTMVLGPYGDVVVRPDGTAYLSWYPVGLQGWTHDPAPPVSWEAPCQGQADAATSAAIAQGVLQAIDGWYRGIGQSHPLLVDAGAIVAYGRTDVGDAASGLHSRTHVGVTSVDGYHSIDPGKLTTAPLFSEQAAERVARL